MTPRTFLSVAASGFVLLGCAYPWPHVASQADCHSQECRVAVPVVEFERGGCIPDAVPDTLNVKARGAVVIRWELDVASEYKGYRFADDGIVFDDASQFQCAVAEQGKKFVCTDRNANPGSYKYTINAIKGSTRCTPHDPWVVNE